MLVSRCGCVNPARTFSPRSLKRRILASSSNSLPIRVAMCGTQQTGVSMRYGGVEYRYAEPFARALVEDPAFRTWVLKQTPFELFAECSRLLNEEMQSQRNAENWWRSHFTEKCRCAGCSGKETDLLAIFEATPKFRFALHIEVKHPGDKFKADGIQPAGYPLRAACWALAAPSNVLPHHQACSVLLFSERNRLMYSPHLHHFQGLITFQQISEQFPAATHVMN
jgi:hypothetical protein